MKQIFTLSIFTLFIFFSNAQTASLVVYTELGEKFTLFLNGETQNETAKSNVKVSGLTGSYYQARIDFAEEGMADFANNNLAVQPGIEATYQIKKNKKGEYVLRFQSEAPLSGLSVVESDENISDAKRISIVDKTPEVEKESETEIQMDGDIGSSTTVTTTTTTKTNGTAQPSEKVGVNMNVGGVNMGVNLNVTGENVNMDVEETQSTTVTSTSTTKTTGTATQVKPQEKAPEVVTVSGCTTAMSKSAFETAKNSIDGKGFDETKLSTAKQVAKSNCLSASQIKEVMELYGFEETKLAFAKYAYDYCMDTSNYYMVSDAFAFSSSTEELNTYIESKN